MTQRIALIILIAVIVLGGGYYAFRQLLPEPAAADQGPVYATRPVVRGDISVGVEVAGPLNPSRGGGIQAPGMGPMGPMPMPGSGPASFVVEEVLVQPGDAVQQGQVLIRFSTAELERRIKDKQKELDADRRSLAAMLGVSPDRLDEVGRGQGMILRAPIDGRVVGLGVKEGEEVKQGQIVARIVDDTRFRLVAKLTPGEFKHVNRAGQRVLLRFSEFDDLVEARVAEVNPNPVPMKSSDLVDSLPLPSSQDELSYRLVYWVTMEGENPGLVGPDMLAQVGLPVSGSGGDGAAGGVEPLLFSRYKAKVEGYADEEQILSAAKAIATRVHVREMQKVKAGNPLVSLIGEDARLMVAEQLETIRQQEEELQALRDQLGQMELRAPMDGIVADLSTQPGMTVQAGQWFGSIYNTSDMQMWSQVDDVDVLRVRQGAPVKVTVDALPGRTLEGQVEQVATMGQDQNGITQFSVVIRVKGTPELRPGMQARAHIDAGSARDVLLIPVEAVFEEDGQPRVEVLPPDGKPRVVPVELGLMNDRVAEVKKGLKEGDLVVTGSTADLLPSQRIQSNDSLLPGNRDTDGGNGAPGNSGDGAGGGGAGGGGKGGAGGATPAGPGRGR